jgi:HSP20 family protein
MNEVMIQQKEPSTHVRQAEVTRGLAYTPRVDVLETETELLLFADLPGVRPDDVEMRFENGELILHGRCKPRQTGTDYLLQEYGVGDFYRAFAIAETIDSDKISAELKDGVLKVHLPKGEAVRPRRITVKGE